MMKADFPAAPMLIKRGFIDVSSLPGWNNSLFSIEC